MSHDNSSQWLDNAEGQLTSAQVNMNVGEEQYRLAALAMQKACELAIKAVQTSIRGTNNHSGGHRLQMLATETMQLIQNDQSVDNIHSKTLNQHMETFTILSNVKEKSEYPDDPDYSTFDLDPHEFQKEVEQIINWAHGVCQDNLY